MPLPFELGVSPLLALPDGRWLLPGLDSVWRDDYDEPLSPHELAMAIRIDTDEDTTTLLAVRLPLAGTTPPRVIARFESTRRLQVAVAP